MSKRFASLILICGVLAGLIAPAGLGAQEVPPATAPPAQQGATTEQPPPPAPVETAPQPTSQPPAPAQATQQQPAAEAPRPPQPAPPKTEAGTPRAVAAAPGSVVIKDFSFAPAALTVRAGDTVTWSNSGPSDHTATASDGSFDTGPLSRGRSGSHTFTAAGTFAYVCSIHPNMRGTVRVVAAAGGSKGGGGGGSSGSSSGPAPGSAPSAGTSARPGRSNLPATGADSGELALVGLGFLLLGLVARRRST